MNFCTNCGNSLSEKDLFCAGCGTKIVRSQAGETPVVQASEDQQQPDNKQPATEADVQTPAVEASEDEAQPQQQQPATEADVQTPAAETPGVQSQPPQQQQPATEADIQASAAGASGVQSQPPQQQQPATEAVVQAPTVQVTDQAVTKPRRKSLKIWIIPISIVLGLILIGYGIYSYLDHKTSLNNAIIQFEQAVINEDIPLLLTMLESGHEDMKLDEKSAEQFVKFLNDDSVALDNIMDYLFVQMDTGRTRADAVISVHTSGKQYLFFDRYTFQVKPMYVNFLSNLPNTDFYIGKEKVASAKEADEEVIAGPFLPGKYEFRAEHEGDYVVLEQRSSDTLFYSSSKMLSFWFDGDYVYLYSYNSDPNIILNGEDIGVKVSDLEFGKFGPLLLDGNTTIALEYEYPWGKERGEELTLDAEHRSSTITDLLNENNHHQTREDIMTVINEFSLSWAEGISEFNANLIKHISDENRSSIEYEMELVKNSDLELSVRLNKLVYNLDSFYFSEYNGEYSAEIQVEVTMTYTYRITGELPYTEEEVTIYTYSLVYDEDYGNWLMSSEWENFSFSATNTQEFRF